MADTQTDAGTQADAGAKPADTPRTFTQDELNAIVARERSKLERSLSERIAALEPRAKLAEELEARVREAEDAKLTQAQRAERDAKREREGYEKRIADLDALSKTEREKRHALLIRAEVSQRMAAVAPKLFNPALADVATREVASRLRVEVDAEGNERVLAVMGAEGDREPLTTAWEKIEREHLAPFFKATGGAGAAHGGGNAGGRAAFAGLSPTDKIAASLTRR